MLADLAHAATARGTEHLIHRLVLVISIPTLNPKRYVRVESLEFKFLTSGYAMARGLYLSASSLIKPLYTDSAL